MLKRVVIVNHLGESMEYAIEGFQADDNPSGLLITSIEGLGPGKATVNTTEIPTSDGGIVNSVRLSGKNIVIKFKFTGVTSVEEARLLSYRTFPIKKKVTFYIETDNREATIDGYVESNEPVVFSKDCEMQVSILCESAYFLGEEIESVLTTSGVTIPYDGDADNGMGIIINMPAAAPVDKFRATDIGIYSNGELLKINTAKLAFSVPNTSPTNMAYNACSFAFTEDKERFIGGLISDEDDVSKIGPMLPVNIGNELHYFGLYGLHVDPEDNTYEGYSSIRHYKIDSSTYDLVRLPDVGYTGDYEGTIYCFNKIGDYNGRLVWSWLQNYNGHVYLYVSPEFKKQAQTTASPRPHAMFEYNIETNMFERLSTCTIPAFELAYVYLNIAAQINNKLYAFFSTVDITMSPSSQAVVDTSIYEFDGESWSLVIEDDPDVANFLFNKYSVVSYGNKVHFFGTRSHELHHLIWDGTNWTINSNELPEDFSPASHYPDTADVCGASVVFGNSVYLICGRNVYEYDGTNYNLIRQIPGPESTDYYSYNGGLGVYADCIFMVGNSFPRIVQHYTGGSSSGNTYSMGSYTDEPLVDPTTISPYTEDPNNVCLIENDVVTISTYKGKKSITLYRDGYVYNIINALDRSSKWLQLGIGNNAMSYSAETGASDLEVTVTSNELYGGV